MTLIKPCSTEETATNDTEDWVTYDELRRRVSKKKIVIIHSSIKDRTLQARIRGYTLRQLRWQQIDAIYDTSKSVKKNLEAFNEMGIKISKTTLYRFIKENRIQRIYMKEEIQKLSEQGHSKKEIRKLLGVTIDQVKWARKKQKNSFL